MTLEEFYAQAVATPPFDLSHNPAGFPCGRGSVPCADMSAHLPLLRMLASHCHHVTEFGLREGFSTAAFLMGLNRPKMVHPKKLVSYDIMRNPAVDTIAAMHFNVCWEFREKDIVEPDWEIEETDFLFVDDLHTFHQVKRELAQHGHKAIKYLGFHDTYSQGEDSLDRLGEKGIRDAIDEYTQAHFWKQIYSVNFNHGLEIYQRII